MLEGTVVLTGALHGGAAEGHGTGAIPGRPHLLTDGVRAPQVRSPGAAGAAAPGRDRLPLH